MSHDWDGPVFQVTFIGHSLADASKRITRSFKLEGMCVWPKGQECSLMKSLDFGAFAVEEFEVEIVGGTRVPATQAEKDAAEVTKLRSEVEKARKGLSEREQAAAERAKVRAACSVVYKNTANKKVGDLTVKEAQQVQGCQVLGLYPPR
jgi:hypothetical protein